MTKERRLGRGLEALLGRIPTETAGTAVSDRPAEPRVADGPANLRIDAPHGATLAAFAGGALHPAAGGPPAPAHLRIAQPDTEAEPGQAGGEPERVDVSLIDSNPYQPRRDFNEAELQSLSESLTAHGLLQPIVVRRNGPRYQLIAGERRLRAAGLAGWSDVPVHVLDVDDRQVAELSIVENLQRQDLNALEKAACFQRYLDQYHCTQDELAGRLKLDRSTIANLIRLLELPEAVQGVLRSGKITQGHARALLPLGDEKQQVAFCRRIEAEQLSVRQTEALVQDTVQQEDGGPAPAGGAKPQAKRRTNPQLAALEQEFRSALGLKVSLQQTNNGRGKLVIFFQGHDEFEHLRQYLVNVE